MKKYLFTQVAVIKTLISVFPMPYGFYFVTRTIFTVLCGYLAFKLFEKNHVTWLVGLGLAILYNPLLPIHLGDKALWILMNLFSCGYVFLTDRRLRINS